jgi:hypothetical protein
MSPAQMMQVAVPMALFAAFMVLALLVRPGSSPATSGSCRALVAFVIAACLAAGLSGRDLWPFASWRYVRYAVGESGSFQRVFAIDESGREHVLDPAAFEPLELAELQGYLFYHLGSLPAAQRSGLLRYMLDRARSGLERTRRGESVGTFARFLGPLAAPTFHADASPWVEGAALPQRLDALRVYRVHWRLVSGRVEVERRELLAATP